MFEINDHNYNLSFPFSFKNLVKLIQDDGFFFFAFFYIKKDKKRSFKTPNEDKLFLNVFIGC